MATSHHTSLPPLPAPLPTPGTQWHPEKPPYEFGMEEVPHSLDAIRVSQHLANVFLEAARMSRCGRGGERGGGEWEGSGRWKGQRCRCLGEAA